MAIDMTDFPVFLNMLANDDNFTTSHIINIFVKRKSVATHKTEQDCKHYVYNDVTCPILMGAIFEIDPKKTGVLQRGMEQKMWRTFLEHCSVHG